MTATLRTTLADWSPPVAGIGLVASSLWTLLAGSTTPATDFLEVTIPLLVGLGLLGITSWYRALDLDPRHKIEIALAAALVGILAVGVVFWEQFLLAADGVAISTADRGQAGLNSVAIGLLAGGTAGYYRARTKRELQDRATAERSFQEIFETIEEALLVHDVETSAIVRSNPKAAELFGYTPEELAGLEVPDLTADHPEHDLSSATEKLAAAKAGNPQRFDWPIERADGETCWVEVTLKAATLEGTDRLLAILRDVEDRRQRQRELEELADGRRDFQEIFEKADVGIALTDPETRMIGRVNRRYAELLGYSRTELLDMDVAAVTASDGEFDDDRARELVERVLDGEPQQFDWQLVRKDGSRFWAELSMKRATIGGEVKVLTFVRDASERKERERKLADLADARHEFQEIFEKADVGIALTDPETRTIGRVNESYADLFGYRPAELEDMDMAKITADDPDYDDERALEFIAKAMEGEPQRFDWPMTREDGSRFWADVSLKRATIGGELRLLTFVRDASERKEREQELQRHRDEMEFFNSLLRHDVLNAVTVIRTHAGKLEESLEGEEHKHAETAVEWADNVTGVVERVRDVLETLTGDREESVRAVDCSAMLRAEVDRLESAHPGVDVETEIPDGVQVEADDLLADVFGNVLTNAVDHNDADGLDVTAAVEPGPETVTIRIADTGAGIPDEDKEAVFRRGKTGHVKKTGSGFGLFFVDSMVEAYGGDVYVEDNQPEGAAIVTELPTADD